MPVGCVSKALGLAAILIAACVGLAGTATAQQVVTDFERPYVYVILPGTSVPDSAQIQFVNTNTGVVDKTIPIGVNPTDATINYGEGRLYVTNWQHNVTRVVDLVTQEQITPLTLGTDVYKINAGRSGRVYYEEEDQWVLGLIIDTATGLQVGQFPGLLREGDAEIDPSGTYYYHCDNNSSGARVTKYDISTDFPVELAESPVHGFGSRNLVMSRDGSRLFWRGYIYDADLNEIGFLNDEIYATSLYGDLAVSETQVYNTRNGQIIYTFGTSTASVGFSGDQSQLIRVAAGTDQIEIIPITDIAGMTGPALEPVPGDASTIVLPLPELAWAVNPLAVSYDVYFGTDPIAVAAANTDAPEYLGVVVDNRIALDADALALGGTYYWRVDVRGITETTTGSLWTFDVAPLVAAPSPIVLYGIVGGPPRTISVTLSADGAVVPWSLTEDVSWLSASATSGSTPATIDITIQLTDLTVGSHTGSLHFVSGDFAFELPVELSLLTLSLNQMVTDYARPYIYALQPGSGVAEDAYLFFINTDTAQVEKAIPIGINPTDMTINYGEDRLYVTNWQHDYTRVVELTTQEQIAPLELGTDVYKINAGRPGRIYYEEEDQWVSISIIDTATGLQVGQVPGSVREGDGEVDPTGSYYYHNDNNISNAHITKYDITTDTPVALSESLEHPYGSRNLVLSADGSRLFWRGYVYDANLNEIGNLGDEIYTTTLHGDLAISDTQVYNTHTGDSLYTLPFATPVSAVSGDQAHLFVFDSTTGIVEAIPMTDIAEIPGPGLNPTPGDAGTIVLPLDELSWDVNPLAIGYRVYFGTDAAAVAAADMNSPEYLGEVTDNRIALDNLALGQIYYWRVDIVGFSGTTIGSVWQFSVAPLIVAPNNLPVSTVVGAPPQTVTLTVSADTRTAVSWSVTEDIPWLSVNPADGMTPGTIDVTLDPEGLTAGTYDGVLSFSSGKSTFEVPVNLELFDLALTRMLTDFERPYIYGLHAGSGDFADAFLVFINTDTAQIEKAIPIGIKPTDMTINYGEGRLYVSNWQNNFTRVVDLTTQEQIAPLELGPDVYRINAGRPGRIYYEEEDQWVRGLIIDTATGLQVGQFPGSLREGDAEIDPTGSYYYHSDNNISNAHITKYDITTDTPVALSESLEHPYGSRNLVLSADGSRLFWRGYVYDDDLNEIGNLGDEIYTTTLHGDLAISETQVYNAHTGNSLYTLPFATPVSAVSGDQAYLYVFNAATGIVEAIPMTDIAEIPGPGLNPTPGDTGTIVLPLDELSWDVNPLAIGYRVYLGTDAAAVAAADTNSPEYLGEVTDNRIGLDNLELGQTYYWRVDIIGFSGITIGSVWRFSVAPLIVAPNNLQISTVIGAQPKTITLTLSTATRTAVSWSVTEDIPWLSVNPADGTTPDTIDVTLDPDGLIAGIYDGVLTFSSGKFTFDVPVDLELFDLALTQMLTDFDRPYVYGLHPGSGDFEDAFLVFINTDTEQIENAIPIGIRPTDMTINYAEGRLYVTNWLNTYTRVVDLTTQQQVEPLDLGMEVFRINAGRAGRVYTEDDNLSGVSIFDTTTGVEVSNFPFYVGAGDGEIDLTGNYYYHGDNNTSNAHLTKFDISTDNVLSLATSVIRSYGSRNLVLSGDGSRLFWQGYIYDDSLNEIGDLDDEIYSTTLGGQLAIGETQVYNSQTGAAIYTLPFTTQVTTVSSDQSKLFLFDPGTSTVAAIPMADIAGISGLDLNPAPADISTVVLPLDELSWIADPGAFSYHVYFGTDPAAVAAADFTAPEYRGEVFGNTYAPETDALALGQTYYWRVDGVGFLGTTTGPVWSFSIFPLIVDPASLRLAAVNGGPRQIVELGLSSGDTPLVWSVTEDVPWIELNRIGGSTPSVVQVALDPEGLQPGTHTGSVLFAAGGMTYEVHFEFDVFTMVLSQMLTDFERPYVYGLHPGSGSFEDAFLVFINTDTGLAEKAISIGIRPTDMTINYGEGRLYVTNWQNNYTRVVDLTTQQQIAPLELGTDVYKINAGRPGRIYYEEEDQWIDVRIIDTATSLEVGQLPGSIREGDGEIDPTGTYYYHSDNNISNAHITKYDISTDSPYSVATSLQHPLGSRHLLMSGDGSRLFWRGYVYDADLNEIGYLNDDILATTLHGDLAFSETQVYNSQSGASIYTLPYLTPAMAMSGDQASLFLFNPLTNLVDAIPITDIADIPGPGLNPTPGDMGTIVLPLDELSWDVNPLAISYRVYLGNDAAAVAAADTNSPEYLGEVTDNRIGLDTLALGQTYYWRVDIVGFAGTTMGSVWWFNVAPLIVTPNNLSISTVAGAPPNTVTLDLSANGTNVAWSATEEISWLTLDTQDGVTPGELAITLDPAGLVPGVHAGAINFAANGFSFEVPVEFEVFEMALTQMLTDFERPYIYGLHAGSGNFADAFLIFINTHTKQVEKAIPIGINPTDMTINYGEGRLYVSNWQQNFTRIVDLTTQEQIEPLSLGTDVYKINAGRPGRIYYEQQDQWIYIATVDTTTGLELNNLFVREGDGEVDPTGSYYYHSDNNISNAHITKYDITADTPVQLAESLVHAYGSRNLVLSADGSRLFWRGYVYDANLNEIGNLGDEIYTTTLHGDLAISDTQVYNTHTGDSLYTLPFATPVSAVSGDQAHLFVFDSTTGIVEAIPMTDIAEIPGPGLNPTPGDAGTIVLPLDELSWDVNPLAIGYRVYFGTDAAAVAAADMNSPEYLGEVTDNRIALDNLALGQIYYWRVDIVGFSGTTIGSVWQFSVAPLIVAPNNLPVSTVVGAPPQTVTLTVSADTRTAVSWSVTEDIPWLSVNPADGMTPGTIDVTLDPEGLTAGTYDGVLSFSSGKSTFEVPVNLELFDLALTRMLTDFERPYIYGLHAGSGDFADAFLVFINTDTAQIEKAIPIGINPTDMTINYGEGRLYVSNWQNNFTRVVDLTTQEQIAPLELGPDVYRINAGRPGRIYYEEEDQWIDVPIIDTATGLEVGQLPGSIREGDAEIDPTGSYYYHCGNDSSAARITKYDITTDSPVQLAESLIHGFGSRNLVLSADGSRLFWRGYIYDDDLNEIGNLSDEIYTTTLHGDLAISATQVYNTHTGDALYTLPFATPVSAVSGDQASLYVFNPTTGVVEAIPMTDIAEIPGPGLNPTPGDTGTIVLPLDELSWDVNPLAIGYRVYLGTDAAAVAAADTNSPEYLGEVTNNRIGLDTLALGQAYYWRVDIVGFAGTRIGPVWSFSVMPLVVSPNALYINTVIGAQPNTLTLEMSANDTKVPWSATEEIEWLTLGSVSGVTPGVLEITIDSAGLLPGVHVGVLNVVSGGFSVEVPVELEVFEMALTQMLTDFERPYIYGLHAGSGSFEDAFLIFINTDTAQIEKAIPIGINPTDMTINYGEGRLYVSNWQNNFTRVVDLATQEQMEPLSLGTDVYNINAGRPGRIYYEEEDQWVRGLIIDTATGLQVGQFPGSLREGDAEIDPTGTYYYHCDNNSSAADITKYDISTDTPVAVATSLMHGYGSRNLVLSADGSRLFWRGYVYDDNLNEIGNLNNEIYTSTLHGDLAISQSRVYNTHTGNSLYTLPFATQVSAVSGDQATLFLYNPATHGIESIPMTDIADIPGPGLNPKPGDMGTIILPLDELSWDINPLAIGYQVYFGTDAVAVAAADMNSPEYLGEVTDNRIGLDTLALGQTYYWRVDIIGFSGTTIGSVWRFSAAPLIVAPNNLQISTVAGAPPNTLTLTLSANGANIAWSATEQSDWLSLDTVSGVTPGDLEITLDSAGLVPGVHVGAVNFVSDGFNFDVPIEFEVFEMTLTQMLTDFERPYVYALHAGSGNSDAFLIFINTDTGQIQKAIPIGINPTDMTINYGEGRLYVTNWQNNFTRVVDLTTQEQIAPLELGPDVYKINAGRPGRIYYEEEDQWIDVPIINTATGLEVGQLPGSIREGDGEIDPTGSYYYHSDNNISNAHITKYDISTDSPVSLATSLEHSSGSRTLVLSPDGSRLFWRGYVYDDDLNEVGYLGDDIYATTLGGDIAISATRVYNTHTGAVIYTLPFTTTVTAVSADQANLFLYDPQKRAVVAIPMSDIADIPGPGLNPSPGDTGTIVLPLDRLSWDASPLAISYRVYLGTDAAAVAAADGSSPEYLGASTDSWIAIGPLDLSETYYWRVDIVGFSGTTIGSVWSFSVAPLIVTPNDLQVSTVVGAQANSITLTLTADGASVAWNATEQVAWLALDADSGVTPGELTITLDPAGLAPGVHIGAVSFASSGTSFEVPVELEVFEMILTQLVTDFERPYVYGLHAGSGDFEDARLVFINTDTDQVEKVIPIGINPTDMAINYGEDRLYVTNWQHNYTRVVDLITQEQITPLNLGPDVYRINAGIAGRIYTEEEDQWVSVRIINTVTGMQMSQLNLREGDGEMDPTGTFYYHCDNNISDAHITKYRVFGDAPVVEATSLEHPYGSRNLVISRNGGRLFWRGFVYNANLDELLDLGDEIYASSLDGGIAISDTAVYDTLTGDTIYSLPFTTSITTVSADQAKLYLYNPVTREIVVVPTAEFVSTIRTDRQRVPFATRLMELLRMDRESAQGHRPLH